MANGRGGARPGAGRKPGSPNKATRKKKQSLAELAQTHTEEALGAIVEVMRQSQNLTAKLKAAETILDRGHGRVQVMDEGADDATPGKMTFNINVSEPVKDVRVTKAQ